MSLTNKNIAIAAEYSIIQFVVEVKLNLSILLLNKNYYAGKIPKQAKIKSTQKAKLSLSKKEKT